MYIMANMKNFINKKIYFYFFVHQELEALEFVKMNHLRHFLMQFIMLYVD